MMKAGRDGKKEIEHHNRQKNNCSTQDSRMVSHYNTNWALWCLTMADRTGSRIFTRIWPQLVSDATKTKLFVFRLNPHKN
jgi:hypothetical protein